MLALALVRILHLEHHRTIIVFETVTIYLLLPAYVILIFASFARRRLLFVGAAFLVLCHLIWFVPEFTSKRTIPKEELAHATHVTLYSQNVEFNNATPEKVGIQIRQINADIVMLQEFSTPDFNAMWAEGAFDAYKYSFVQTAYGPTGVGVFSKYPLSDSQLVSSPGFPQIRTVANVNGQSVVLWDVHMRAPVDGPITHWLGDFGQLKARIHSETQPTLVAGDFNATWGHRPFRELLTDGYHEAAVDLGQAYNRTWPVDTKRSAELDGFVRFDHVLYNSHLQATSQHEVPGGGSDHRGVVTHLALFKS
jgi:endonuclease/exonuclease/phosphatase (EEP) superfamily protein YafD